MPKAAMDKNCSSGSSENNVWGSRKISLMKAKAIPQPMNNTSHNSLGLRVLALYKGHKGRSSCRDGTNQFPRSTSQDIAPMVWLATFAKISVPDR